MTPTEATSSAETATTTGSSAEVTAPAEATHTTGHRRLAEDVASVVEDVASVAEATAVAATGKKQR